VAGSAAKAREFLKGEGEVVQGAAEQIPLPDASQRIVLLESVLEHVDSPERCIAECYRILEPGGVLFVYTTNRYRFSLVGRNQEYTTRYFNWFPRLVKEMYVFHHLHYDPRLASYTPRPGVHWFSYADLCALGRRAGFGQFYSKLDLADPDSPIIARSWLRRRFYQACKYRPWLKALALLQFGNSIFMWKRPE
jgi:SAM-dependent methyltransferase